MMDSHVKSLKEQLDALSKIVTDDDAPDEIRDFFRQHFHLPGNPFPPSGIADATEENPPLTPEIAEQVLDFILRSYKSGQSDSMIVSGEYGTGKTHTLRFIEHVVNSLMNKGDRRARAIYIERPRIEVHELNRTILRSLGHDTVRKYIWVAIHGVLLKEITSQSQNFKQLKRNLSTKTNKGPRQRVSADAPGLFATEDLPLSALIDTVFSTEALADYRTFLAALEGKGWDREIVRPFLVQCLLQAVGDDATTELPQAFVALLLARDEASFATWETIVSISKTKSLSSLRAPTFLQFLLHVMKLNGIVYVYLLLDEFEEVPQGFLLSPRQRQDYLYTMREVFDKVRRGLGVVMAIVPGALVSLNELAPPFADRNPRKVDLPPIQIDEAVKVVQSYFDRERKNSDFKHIRKGDLKPLNRELLSYVLDNLPPSAPRTPRSLIQFLHRLLDHAAQYKVEDITPEITQSLLAEFGVAKSGQSPSLKKRR